MATYYVDPIGGNDASVGTSFATRWQTLTNGATAARIAPGDEIRIIASPEPTSLGNATWTNDSYTVTLASAVTARITYANNAWTASANVTTSGPVDRKVTTASAQISVAAGFTTGKAAYQQLTPALDLSGYQQVSFWIKQTAGSLSTGDGEIELRLCSDTIGNTVVNTISIPQIPSLNLWSAYTVNLGTALGSSIQSIAFAINTDRGAQTFLLNNIIACKDPTLDDSLSLTSLISKNTGTEAWYAIQSIDDATITLDKYPNYNINVTGTGRGYPGTTQTVTTYKREPINLPSSLVANASTSRFWGQLNDSGTSGNPITYSGGWNRTDMSTKTGKTYISGVNGNGVGIATGSGVGRSFITLTDINLFRFNAGLNFADSSTDINFTADDISYHANGVAAVGGGGITTWGPSNNNYTITNIVQNQNNGFNIGGSGSCGSGIGSSINLTNLSMNWTNGFSASSTPGVKWIINITNLDNNGAVGGSGIIHSPLNCGGSYFTYNVTNMRENRTGINFQGYNSTINLSGTLFSGSNDGEVIVINNSDSVLFNLTGATITRATNAVLCSVGGTANIASNITFRGGTWTPVLSSVFSLGLNKNIVVDNATLVSGNWLSVPSNFATQGIPSFRLSRPGGVANNSKYYNSTSLGYWEPSTAVVRTAGGISWLAVNWNNADYPSADYPNEMPIATVAVDSGGLVTASIWAYLTNANNVIKLVCKGGQIAGVPNDVIATSSSGTLNAWQQLTITFTPSAKGAVQIVAQAYGGTTNASYIDDFSVTQA